MNRRISLLSAALLCTASYAGAQNDVTDTYIQNSDFAARFAGWTNEGSFSYNTSNFSLQNGDVFLEKWVSSGSKLGTNKGIFQTLRNLTNGTYTLVASAQNIQQSNTGQVCTGAYLYAGNEQTEVNAAGDYSVVFTVANGTADIGFKLTSCTGNWACIDNFRLYYNGVNQDSLDAETIRIATERAELIANLENATGKIPTVVTNPYVAMGSTIALGRSTVTANGATIKERGFCWSTSPNPTILDDKTTSYFSNNGFIYRMEGLKPATIYYVRAYALTSGYQVGYGDVVKIATMPKGSMTSGYDMAGDDDQNKRIGSAVQECVWMYNNLCNISNFYLSVHYVYGAGAGTGTADCSYGGYMRVSQSSSYQQTGTILHETNHGVGVGTTNEWYNNSNLRENTSSGKWLGPRATQMVRFLENNEGAYMQGDGTHMWAGTTSGSLTYGYGINGASEDSYQPSNQLLYYGNVLITHAMHQDGLISTSSRGFATPAYVFTQDDSTKYYIRCESENAGGPSSYLGMTATGSLKSYVVSKEEALQNDNYAWYITYDPKSSYYIFYNVGTKKYLTNSSSTIKAITKTAASTTENFHLMPARSDVSMGDYTGTGYWILTNSGHYALQGGTTYSAGTASYSTSTATFDASNSATAQRWLLLTADDVTRYDSGATQLQMDNLNELLTKIQETVNTPHTGKTEETDVTSVNNTLEQIISEITTTKESYASVADVSQAISALQTALTDFLSEVTPTSVENPFDLTYLITNANFDTDNSGWTQTSGTTSYGYQCLEFFEETYDFNQTINIKLPVGTYVLKAQAFQRPGSYANVYTDYVTNGTDNVKAQLYLKTKSTTLKNIFADAQTTSQGTGSVSAATKCYIPNSMQGAYNFFRKGFYDNQVMVTTTTAATMKLGIRCATSSSNYWTCFDNFRLYYYGAYSTDDVTPVEEIITDEDTHSNVYYDLSGRQVLRPTRGIYIVNGKKVIIR